MAYLSRLTKRLAVAWLLIVVVAGTQSCSSADAPVTSPEARISRQATTPAVASVSISPSSASGSLGQSAQFTATALDANGNVVTGQTATWTSTDSTIVSVSSTGFATAVGVGPATLVATVGGVSGRASASVSGTAVATIFVNPPQVTGVVGQTGPFAASLEDAKGNGLTGRRVLWTSSAPAVVKIDTAGNATALANGTATITAYSEGKTGKAVATVTGGTPTPTVASVAVSPGSASGAVGQSEQFAATAYDSSGKVLTGLATTWATSNASVATVTASGNATGVTAGSASISASIGGKKASAAITVTGSSGSSSTPASSTVSPSSATVTMGATQQLTVSVLNAVGGLLGGLTTSWTSSAPSVATVNASGLVTGVSAGTATITATTLGVVATSAITVSGAPVVPPSGSEPVFAAGNTMIWSDSFNGLLSDAQMLANYVLMDGENGIHFDATAGIGGSGALRVDWTGSTGCQDEAHLIERDFPAATQEIYVTYSVRYTPNFVFDWTQSGYSGCTGNAKKLFFLWAGSGNRFDFISENHTLGMGSDYDHPLFQQNAGSPVTDEQLGDGQWHRITMHVRQSSTPTATDGFIYGWIDGVQRWSYPNIASNASGGWVLLKMPTTFNEGSPVHQSEWLDNLQVWRP